MGTLLFLQLSVSLTLLQDKKKNKIAATEVGKSRHGSLRGWLVTAGASAGARALTADCLIPTIL